MYRSMLFVPGDSERKMAKARDGDADALILDLEDAVVTARRAAARQDVRAFISDRVAGAGAALFVRINPLSSPDALLDLAAV